MLLVAVVSSAMSGRGLVLILPLRERAGRERRSPSRASRRTAGAMGRRERDMGLFDRLRGGRRRAASGRGDGSRRGTLDRGSQKDDLAHIEQFIASRRGVEG